MELDVFVSETLKAIVKGVKESQDFASEHGAIINPIRFGVENSWGVKYRNTEGIQVTTNIEFDVAITVSSEKESGLNGGIKVVAAEIGGKKSLSEINETISRVAFHISVALPSVVPQ